MIFGGIDAPPGQDARRKPTEWLALSRSAMVPWLKSDWSATSVAPLSSVTEARGHESRATLTSDPSCGHNVLAIPGSLSSLATLRLTLKLASGWRPL